MFLHVQGQSAIGEGNLLSTPRSAIGPDRPTAGRSETKLAILNSILRRLPICRREQGEKDENQRGGLRYETDPDGADFTIFLQKVASARHLNRMTQVRPFWKAERMNY